MAYFEVAGRVAGVVEATQENVRSSLFAPRRFLVSGLARFTWIWEMEASYSNTSLKEIINLARE